MLGPDFGSNHGSFSDVAGVSFRIEKSAPRRIMRSAPKHPRKPEDQETIMKYRILDGSEKMNIDEVTRLLKMTYWADKRSAEQIRKSMNNSSCYGVYLDDEKKLVS